MTRSFLLLLVTLVFAFTAVSGTAVHAPTALARWESRSATACLSPVTTKGSVWNAIHRGGGNSIKFPNLLQIAYSLAGIATSSAWTTIVYTTIRSNQPVGALMPTLQHGLFARIGAMSAVPLIVSSFHLLYRTAASWETMQESGSSRRHNLALATACAGSAVWTACAATITAIPGSAGLSHQAYHGITKATLVGSYTAAAVLCGATWVASTCYDKDSNAMANVKSLLTAPVRIADGVASSLYRLAPKNIDDPVNVKYAVIASSMAFFTASQLLGPHPWAVIPSWTGRRLARAFPAWTLLAAVSAFDLKEAVEHGKLGASRGLAAGIQGFGTLYLGAKVGAIFLDSSFPESYHAVNMVPGWAAAAIVLVGFTLRSDQPPSTK